MGAHIQYSWRAELLKFAGYGGTPVVPLCQRCHNCQGGEIELKETPCIIDGGGNVLDLRGMQDARFGEQRLEELNGMGASSLQFLAHLYGLEVGPSPVSTAQLVKMLYNFEVAWGLS